MNMRHNVLILLPSFSLRGVERGELGKRLKGKEGRARMTRHSTVGVHDSIPILTGISPARPSDIERKGMMASVTTASSVPGCSTHTPLPRACSTPCVCCASDTYRHLCCGVPGTCSPSDACSLWLHSTSSLDSPRGTFGSFGRECLRWRRC